MLATVGLIARALIQMWSRQLPLGEGVAGVPKKPAVVLKPARPCCSGRWPGSWSG